jgi:hypothetical protein
MNALPDDLPNFPDPPEPRAAEWQRVREAVRQQVLARQTWVGRVALVGGAIAASVVIAVLAWPVKIDPQSARARKPVQPADWLAEYDVLPIATGSHLMLSALNGPNDETLLTVDHPLKARMNLASTSDTTFTNDDANRVLLDTTEVK